MEDLVFNELTTSPLAPDFNAAFERVKGFIYTYKKKPAMFNRMIRLDIYIGELQLTEGMSLQDFCNETPASRTLGSLLLGLGKHPFIDEGTDQENQYLEHDYFFDRNGIRKATIGLAAAYLRGTVCIGFASEECWENVECKLIVSEVDGSVRSTTVLSASTPNHFSSPSMNNWVEKNETITLVEGTLDPTEKTIHLRDDHGKDILQKCSERLRRSPYVLSIVNSLPFNPKQRNFIKSVSPSGLIEIVLIDTDKGLGLVVQTTGRNLRETEEIANILSTEYS